jgi:uncharacterized protein YaaN involved in tellurite resistance
MDKETREIFEHVAIALQAAHTSFKEIVAAIEELDESNKEITTAFAALEKRLSKLENEVKMQDASIRYGR